MLIILDPIACLRGSDLLKPPVRAATTGDIALSRLQTIDGVALGAGTRVLVKDQAIATQNGVWITAEDAWTRARDFNGARDVQSGTMILVTSGAANAGVTFRLVSESPVVGLSPLVFAAVASTSAGLLLLMSAALGDGETDSRPALAAADSSSGLPLLLPAGTYRIASDLAVANRIWFSPGARLKPDAGVTVHLMAGYGADDWQHVFDVSAPGSSVSGGRAPNGYVTPQHWGANPIDPAVDDRPAIEAATEYATLDVIRDEYAAGFPVKFPDPGSGNYYLTRTREIQVARTTHWYGETRTYSRKDGGVEIRAADGLDAVVFAFHAGGASAPVEYETTPAEHAALPGIAKTYGALRSRFEDLSFLPESGATVRQGFVHNCVCFLDRCVSSGFTEAAFHAHAQTSGSMLNRFAHPGISNDGNTSGAIPASDLGYDGQGAVYGNVNGSIYTGCYASAGVPAVGAQGGSHGFVMHGNNAGTVKYIGCDAHGFAGAGFLENTTIGCELFGCHSATNCWDVEHNGARYICIKGHTAGPSSEPGVGVDWRTHWIENTSRTGNSIWASGTYYHPTAGINICSGNSRTTIVAHYTEGGIEVGVIGRDRTAVLGGNAVERTPWHGEFAGCRVIGHGNGFASPVGYTGRTDPGSGATEYGGSWGAENGYTGGRIAQFGDARDDATNTTSAMRQAWSNTRKIYEWTVAGLSSRMAWGITGLAHTFPGRLIANGFILARGDAAVSGQVRIRTATDLASITAAAYGDAVQGDIWFYAQPSAGGKIGAVCTAAGIIGSGAVLKEFGSIDP